MLCGIRFGIGRSGSENLDIYFGPPEEFFLASDTQSPYTDGGLIPILDDGNFGIVTFLDPKARTIVQKDVERPFEECARFQDWQQYLGWLVIVLAESIDDDEATKTYVRLGRVQVL